MRWRPRPRRPGSCWRAEDRRLGGQVVGSGHRPEAGGATVLVVAMAGILLFVMVGLAAAGGLVTAQRRAQAAADLAALGAASTLDEACRQAAWIAAAHAAALESCEVAGDEVTVTVSVDGPRVPWRDVRVGAEARAGPG